MGLEGDPSKAFQGLDARQDVLDQRKDNLGYPALPKSEPNKQLASRFGLAHDYRTVEYMHQVVNGNAQSHVDYRKNLDNGDLVEYHMLDTDPMMFLYTAALASKLLLLSYRATAEILGWIIIEQYEELMEHVQEELG